jgi:hypothetical protein
VVAHLQERARTPTDLSNRWRTIKGSTAQASTRSVTHTPGKTGEQEGEEDDGAEVNVSPGEGEGGLKNLEDLGNWGEAPSDPPVTETEVAVEQQLELELGLGLAGALRKAQALLKKSVALTGDQRAHIGNLEDLTDAMATRDAHMSTHLSKFEPLPALIADLQRTLKAKCATTAELERRLLEANDQLATYTGLIAEVQSFAHGHGLTKELLKACPLFSVSGARGVGVGCFFPIRRRHWLVFLWRTP